MMKSAFAIGSVLCLIALSACRDSGSDSAQQLVEAIGPDRLRVAAEAMANLSFATARNEDFPDVLNVMGKVSPTEDRMVVIPARAPGRIESLTVTSGETVKQGQEVCTIFSADFIAAREEFLQSLRQESKSGASEGSQRDFANLARLAQKKLESLGLSKADIEALKASAQADADGAKIDGNLVVRAPRGGAIITKNAIAGNQVNLGDPLFMVADLHAVWFLGDLYPEDVTKAKKGQEVFLDAGTGKMLKGTVSFISPVVDPNTRTIKIRALIDNPDLALRADMYLQGGLVISHRDAVVVPVKSLLRTGNSNFVFKLTGGQIKGEGQTSGVEVQKIPVVISSERQGLAAIGSGLQSGDQVVSEGALLLEAALSNANKK